MERALTSVARRVDLAAALAADWMQEARLHLLVHGPTIAACFRGDALAETYLHAVLRNHCVNWLKARRRAVPRALGVEQVPRRLRRALEVRDPDPLETTEAGAVSAQREAAF
jgi:DNA-directed RNA polymerase specialized sigma24 family protein